MTIISLPISRWLRQKRAIAPIFAIVLTLAAPQRSLAEKRVCFSNTPMSSQISGAQTSSSAPSAPHTLGCYFSDGTPRNPLALRFAELNPQLQQPPQCNGGQVCPRIRDGRLDFLDCDDRAWLYCLNMPEGTCWQVAYFAHWLDIDNDPDCNYIGHVIVIVRRSLPDGRYQYCAVEPEGDIEIGCFEPCSSPDVRDCVTRDKLRVALCNTSTPIGRLDCRREIKILEFLDAGNLSHCFGFDQDGWPDETPWWMCGSYENLLSMCSSFDPDVGPTLECLPQELRQHIPDCEKLYDATGTYPNCRSGDVTLCNALDPFDPSATTRRLRPLYCCPHRIGPGTPWGEGEGRWNWGPRSCS